MARNRVRRFARRHHVSKRISLGLVMGLVPVAKRLGSLYKAGGMGYLPNIYLSFIPYDFAQKRFDPQFLSTGLYPVAAGVLLSKLATKLGVNRAIANLVPYVKI